MGLDSLYLTKTSLISTCSSKTKISIIGIPFDSTSIEYPGQRFGPKSIRETISRFYGYENTNYKNNFYNQIEDLGDIDVVHGSFEETSITIDKFIKEFKEQKNTLPVFLGGEHLISLATIKSLSQLKSAKNKKMDLIVFDAHSDCYETYKGEKFSHISWLNKVLTQNYVNHVYLIGARAIDKEEYLFMQKMVKNNKLTIIESAKELDKFLVKLNKNKLNDVYVSIDLDVLDFNLAIGTGTPEYDGMNIYDLVYSVEQIISKTNIVGLDIVELNPMIDNSRITSYCASILLKKIILEFSNKNYKHN
jgi:agmatinase